MGALTTFAWVMWFTSLITINTGSSRSPLHLARSSSNAQIIQRIAVSSGHHHNSSSARPAWQINPRRLIHNLLPPMTPLLKLFSNVVDLPPWPHTPKANHTVWATSIMTNTSLWDTNYKKEGIMTMLKVNNNEKCRIIMTMLKVNKYEECRNIKQR